MKKSDIILEIFIYLNNYIVMPDKQKAIANIHFDYIKREKNSFSSKGIFQRKLFQK
jgi:hypothetical protein